MKPLEMILLAALALAACTPAGRPWTDAPRKGGEGRSAPAPILVTPVKPIPPVKLPPDWPCWPCG